jgi:hypothetical protein
MNTTEITVLEEIELDNPIFIEALPGLGHVGKLAADHMIDELGATKFAEIYSPTFPPQVLVKEEGIIDNMLNELYYLNVDISLFELFLKKFLLKFFRENELIYLKHNLLIHHWMHIRRFGKIFFPFLKNLN